MSETGKVRLLGLVLLAAGSSTRMGKPKQLLQHEGKSLLRLAAEAAASSRVHLPMVVVGAEKELAKLELHEVPVLKLENPLWETGVGSSIARGIKSIPGPVEAVVIMRCDQPHVTKHVIDKLVETYFATGKHVVASEYDGGGDLPALFTRPLFSRLSALRGEVDFKPLIAALGDHVTRVPFPEGALDINTPEDYSRWTASPA